MAQFKAFSPGVEVNGEAVLTFINSIPVGKDLRTSILASHGIVDPKPGKWYPQQAWLDGFEEVARKVGANTLFMIGRAIPENAQFPSDINSLEKALQSLDIAYHMNHRGGDIGYYKLVSFSLADKKAVIECKNPYPSEFDKGIIISLFRKFKTPEMFGDIIALDGTKESRLYGADSCTFILYWNQAV